jgi:hypothetical protein
VWNDGNNGNIVYIIVFMQDGNASKEIIFNEIYLLHTILKQSVEQILKQTTYDNKLMYLTWKKFLHLSSTSLLFFSGVKVLRFNLL